MKASLSKWVYQLNMWPNKILLTGSVATVHPVLLFLKTALKHVGLCGHRWEIGGMVRTCDVYSVSREKSSTTQHLQSIGLSLIRMVRWPSDTSFRSLPRPFEHLFTLQELQLKSCQQKFMWCIVEAIVNVGLSTIIKSEQATNCANFVQWKTENNSSFEYTHD